MTLQAQYTTTTPAFRLTDTPASGVALPLTDPSAIGNRPLAAFLQADTHDIRFTVDGTAPTASVGTLLVAGAAPFLYTGDLSTLRFIQTESGSKLNVVYSYTTVSQGMTGAQGAQGPQGEAGSGGSGSVRLFKKVINFGDFPVGTPSEVPLYSLPPTEVVLFAALDTLIEYNDATVSAFVITKSGASVQLGAVASASYTVLANNAVAGLKPLSTTTYAGWANFGPAFNTTGGGTVNLVVRANGYAGDGTAGQSVAYLLIATPVTS